MIEDGNVTIDPELESWNDEMYEAHPTPYSRGIAARIQKARVEAVMRSSQITAQDAVLEVGCESGHLLISAPPCRRLAGADISGRALADAEALFRQRGRDAEFHQVDAEQPLPFEPGEFDVIICSEMLEHVHEPRKVIENIHAIAGPNTRVVLTVPIEAPKVKIKDALTRIGLMGLLFPDIEEGQSEWHLQAFSRKMLLQMTDDLFDLQKGKFSWGSNYVARFRRK